MGLSPATTCGAELASAQVGGLLLSRAGADTIVFLAGLTVALGAGVLIGSSLHTRSIDRRYRRLAQRVRHLNERETALGGSGYPARVCDSCLLELHRGALLVRERPPPVDED